MFRRLLPLLVLLPLLAVQPATAHAHRAPGVLAHNRWAGPDGTATMHGDSGSSDTTPYAGPGADAATAQPVPLGGVCPTILAGRDGMPQALCTEYSDRAPTLNLLDPDTFAPLARLHLSAGSLLGGVYAYVDAHDQLVTVDGSGAVLELGHDQRGPGGTWRVFVAHRIPVTAALTRASGGTPDAIATVAPGYDGRIWFATAHGLGGYADPRTGHVRVRRLGPAKDGKPAEIVANSISTAPAGTAITTDHATYLLRARADGSLRVLWRRTYDRGSARKPGQLSRGSGATPTFFGPRTGQEWIAITDDARPREHLLVYRAATGRRVCSVPILGAANSGTENSPVGFRRHVFVASTYGYPYPATPDGAGPAEPATADFVGGMQRIDVTRHGCRRVWTNRVRSAAVPRLARGENVLYTVTRSPSLVYRLTRVSPATGRVLSQSPIGAGPTADTLQMVGTILPDGTLLQGNLVGLTVSRPGG